MALIGSVVNQGSIQGQINDANGYLTGVISSAELLGGQVVGMRGFKGDKGDPGDPGADGADGQDGFSPIANVSKVGDTATITITDSLGTTTATVEDGADGQDGQDGADGHSPVITANKVGKVTTIYADGVAIATINDGQDGGGSGVFIAEIGTTSYSDIDTAFQGGKLVIGRVSGTGDTYFPLVVDNSSYYNYYSFQVTSGKFVFEYKIDNTDEWTTDQYVIATDDEATTSKKGLMSSSDKTKLNGIESGAEVNVQSDWNQSVNTADDYIKNKPTLFSGDYDDLTNKPTLFSGNYNDLSNKPTIPTKISDLLNDLYEKGTTTAGSVTWTYRKWADKELEMWGEASTTLAINTASGSLYTTANTYDVAMPSFVASCDFFTGELSGGGWVDVTDMTNPPKVRFYAPTSYASATRYLRYYMKGTWT